MYSHPNIVNESF